MKPESNLVVEIWDLVRDQIQPTRRLDTAVAILRACEEFGMEERDLQDIVDEDNYLSRAFHDVFDVETDSDNSNDDDGDE